ncbi:MAG: hypothetical protein QF664_11880 [Dehalococcoidia bacterium]|jgi:hypothetical protein|nr:hypothetical protein [Dehalococcoidia bacterium]
MTRREPISLFSSDARGARRPRRRVRRVLVASCLVWSMAWSMSCNELVTDGNSSSVLVIELLDGSPGLTDSFGGSLASDVQTDGGVTSDLGRVSARLALKDPGTSANPATPTSANWITVTRYRVEYIRGDGRNTPGVDVPYPIDGGVSFTVIDLISQQFVLVRAQAKLEPPLRALKGLGGAVLIATVARVTFYGHDQTGADVRATANISVTFADWADPES